MGVAAQGGGVRRHYSWTLLIRIATFAHFNVFLMSHRPAVACVAPCLPACLRLSVCLFLYLISIFPALSPTLFVCVCVSVALRCLELTLYAKIINH